MSNYIKKIWFKKFNRCNTSGLVEKADYVNLKLDIDRLDIDKLESTPTDLSKQSNVVKNDAVKMLLKLAATNDRNTFEQHAIKNKEHLGKLKTFGLGFFYWKRLL